MLHRIVYWIIDLMSKIIGRVLFPRSKTSSSTETILRNYKNNPDFRVSLVEESILQSIHPGSVTLSTDEILAVLSIWSAQKPLDEVFALISKYSSDGWGNSFDNQFFEKLSNTTATWRYKGLNDVADNLLKIGKHMAEVTRNTYYTKEFDNEIFRREQDKDRVHLNRVV